MSLIDFAEPRMIALLVGGGIALTSLTIILIRYLLREHKRKKEAAKETEK